MATMMVACQAGSRRPSSDPIRVARVDPARYTGAAGGWEEAACRRWRLSAAQVEQFFRLSQQYPENPYSLFYQTPCVISGELQAEGRAWRFEIAGGATATWTHGNDVRHWGCSAKACEALVILATDLMDPDAR